RHGLAHPREEIELGGGGHIAWPTRVHSPVAVEEDDVEHRIVAAWRRYCGAQLLVTCGLTGSAAFTAQWASTASHQPWPHSRCTSCARAVCSEGATSPWSAISAKCRPRRPVIAIVVMPLSWAADIAAVTLGEPPL